MDDHDILGDSEFPQTQALMREILLRSDTRKRERVSGLWNILSAMRKKGLVDFAVAAVGRECERAGFLKTQSIRNSAGVDYLEIIKSFRSEAGIGLGRRASSGGERSVLVDFIKSISDIQIRIRLLEIVESELRQFGEIARLRYAFKHISETRRVNGREPDTAATDLQAHGKDLAPLDSFITSEWLDTNRLEVRKSGAIYTVDGDRITPDGFVPCLVEVLSGAKPRC